MKGFVLWCSLALPGAVLAQSGSYYVEPGSYGTRRDSEPPAYVRQGGEGNELPDWLQLGADNRLRFEFRDDDIRRSRTAGLDSPLLLRTRLYVGRHGGR